MDKDMRECQRVTGQTRWKTNCIESNIEKDTQSKGCGGLEHTTAQRHFEARASSIKPDFTCNHPLLPFTRPYLPLIMYSKTIVALAIAFASLLAGVMAAPVPEPELEARICVSDCK